MKRIPLLFLLLMITLHSTAQDLAYPVGKHWQFRQAGATKWYPAEVPGTVHTDLLNNKLIPDPFYRDNEKKVQWVEKQNWEYRTVFKVADEMLAKENIDLIFEGLDTYARIFLNRELVFETNNMFREWKVAVNGFLKKGENELVIHFASAVAHDDSMARLSPVKLPGENSRMYSRKAQFHYGWDWAPRLVTCGIWKPVRIHGYDALNVIDPIVESQPRVKLIAKSDPIGQSFFFERDGKPVFIKGANWVPADVFLPRAKRIERYEMLIKAAKEANINMLRVWGGGIYEDDRFYELCDEYGIMVWQDFMFAGAMYPYDAGFLQNVEEEVRYQVNRLKGFKCIVLWCGNNEIDEAWHNWGWQEQFGISTKDSAIIWEGYKRLFHEMIPRILEELDPGRPYWPSSPSIGWGRDSAYTHGDVHYWGVWWGKEPVEAYNKKVGRFNSEYGMQGMPSMKTIRQFTLPSDLDTSKPVMKAHQKHPFGYENIKLYIQRKFKAPKKFEDLVYVSQLMQADAIRTAIESHLRNKPTTMGTMFWQWNDCWPVTSWSAVDYYGRKKALYYEVKRNFEKQVILPYYSGSRVHVAIASDEEPRGFLAAFVKTLDGKLLFHHGAGEVRREGDQELVLDTAWLRNYYKKELSEIYIEYRVFDEDTLVAKKVFLCLDPKEMKFKKPKINLHVEENVLELTTNTFAYGVFIDVPDGVELDDNYFHLLPNEKKVVNFKTAMPREKLKQLIKVKSLGEL